MASDGAARHGGGPVGSAARDATASPYIGKHRHLWRPVVGYEGLYQVTANGRVRNVQTGEKLKPRANQRGHLKVALYRNGQRSDYFVHRLVLEAFAGPCPEGMEACHGLGGPADNRWPENLRWDTHVANMRDAVEQGAILHGEDQPSAKLTSEQVGQIRALYAFGGESMRELAARFGVHHSTVSRIINEQRWRSDLPDDPPRCTGCGHLEADECGCTCCTWTCDERPADV